MPHDTTLIATIVMGLVLAFALGFLASRLRLPPLVGYLLAGIAVGPHTPGFVGDAGLAGQVAELGVILLMFGVGLHFSLDDLIATRRIALPGAMVQIATATTIGAGLVHLWGWSLAEGVVFGLALSVASTVVLLRALDRRNALETEDGRIAVGWLIVEDLAMILALVLLPALADMLQDAAVRDATADGSLRGALVAIALTFGKAGLFIALMLSIGRRVMPALLAAVARVGSRELFTLSVLAVALGIAFAAALLFGVSFALGAFLAGVVLSESDLSHRAAANMLPLQDAFAVLFFVSVGMLFDPGILVRAPLAVLAVLAIIVIGKSVAAFAIVVAFGYPVGTALVVSASLAQIGEFSFILAGLGLSLGLLPAAGRDLILAGALFSITLNPFVFAAADRLGAWLDARALRRPGGGRVGGGRVGEAAESSAGGGALGRIDGNHAVIVGFGRVGEAIGLALDAWELPYVVIEREHRRVRELRGRGIHVVHGDATAPGVLASAEIARARLLIAAIAHGLEARRVLEMARQANPSIDTVVRTHSEAELADLETAGVGLAVFAERELALGMMVYALRSMGLSEGEARMFVQSSRRPDDTGLASLIEPQETTPELRPRREEPQQSSGVSQDDRPSP